MTSGRSGHVRPGPSGAAIAGVDQVGAPAARAGEDEEWEEFQRKLKEKAEMRKAAGLSEQPKEKRDDVEEVHAEEPESGARKPIKMANPKLPSDLEIEEHELSHVP